MGNTNLANEYKSGKWRVIQNLGHREILQNSERQTVMQVEKHFSMSNFRSMEERYQNTEIYKWRKSLNPNLNIVKLYEYEVKEERFGIQQDQYAYTERINRLSQKGKIYSKAQGFLLLMDLLKGLDILFQQFGIFRIDVFLLGVSFQGKGKVWINQNYARNFIDQRNNIQRQGPNEQMAIINNLVRIIKDRIYNQEFMPNIQFPINMHCKQAISYIEMVRHNNMLFRVNKVYSDRNQFREYYDHLYQQFLMTTNNGFEVPSIGQHPLQRSEVQQIRPQFQRQSLFLKHKHEASETLSSDSNSRKKTLTLNNHEIYKPQDQEIYKTYDHEIYKPQKPEIKRNHNDNKIYIQQMLNEHNLDIQQIQNPPLMTPYLIINQSQSHNNKYIQKQTPAYSQTQVYNKSSGHNQNQNHSQNQYPNQNQNQNLNQNQNQNLNQNPSYIYNHHQNHLPNPNQNQSLIQTPNQNLMRKQRIHSSFTQNHNFMNHQQYVQRTPNHYLIPSPKVYPPEINKAILQRLNSIPIQSPQRALGNIPQVFQHSNFAKVVPNHILPQRFVQQSYPSHQKRQFVQGQPFQLNFVEHKNLSQEIKRVSTPLNQYVPQYVPEPLPSSFGSRQEQQEFINDVELCESVMFDRGQIQRNFKDLDN